MSTTQLIVPHLWFNTEAKEAAAFYTSLLPDSKITSLVTLRDTPSGDCDVVSFTLAGYEFMAISAGPLFTLNPSISFHIKCATEKEVDALWEKLLPGGKALMELGSYPFSKRYGWLEDRYGVSWQIIHTENASAPGRIVPALMFVGEVCGKAEEAAQFYASTFPDSKLDVLARYTEDETPDAEGTVKYASLTLFGQEFGVMDSAYAHKFAFNEAVSLIVRCDSQEEIDRYWETLSAVPESEQCGWLKDRYGVSWQIVPREMDHMMSSSTPEQLARMMQAFMPMKKLDIAAIRAAYEGA